MAHFDFSRWIPAISDLARQGRYRQVVHLFFHETQRHGFSPHPYLLPTVLGACAKLSDVKTGKILHSLVTRCLLDSDAFVDSALIHMYSKCGHVAVARRLFDRMADRDLAAWNAMIAGYVQHGLIDEAMSLSESMQSDGIKPDLLTWNTLISGFSQIGNDEMALSMFSSMRLHDVEPDVFSWTSIISGLVHNGHYERALGVFKEMVAVAKVRPNSATISSILPACATVADSRRGKEIHARSLTLGVGEDLRVSSSLVDMYAKCGLIFDAERIFERMRERNTVSWNSMIFGYANHGYCRRAIQLFYQMEEEGIIRPDHLTFTAVFTACSNAGMVDVGTELFEAMQKEHDGIEPRLEHYACMVDLLGRAGKLAEAYEFIKGMPREPDSFVWGALLGASRKHGDVELAEIAASRLSELEPNSRGSRLLLSSVLADAGRWGDAEKMKILMKKQKLRRYLGSSWMVARTLNSELG